MEHHQKLSLKTVRIMFDYLILKVSVITGKAGRGVHLELILASLVVNSNIIVHLRF